MGPAGRSGWLLASLTALASVVQAEQPPTWNQEAALIVHEHCTECHRPGGSAPMSLLTWEQSRPWARAIERHVTARTMPPWHADPAHGRFSNDRSMPAGERETLLAWAASGALAGSGEPPAPPDYEAAQTDGWRIGRPDRIIELPETVEIPASGEVPYHDYIVDPGFTEDVWVKAAEARPGNPEVVHHIIVNYTIENPLLRRKLMREGLDGRVQGSLGGYVPGDEPLVLENGLARLIPAGARIYFQMHYTPSGTATTDRSSLGLIFAQEPPRHEVRTGIASSPFIHIKPGSTDTELSADFTFRRESVLLSMRPHMHLRGKSFEYKAIYPDGQEEILLSVTDYDFDWQTRYVLAEPKRLPAGTRIECTGSWDNSASNPNNPDPDRTVSWGQQTEDEMMIGFFEYYETSSVTDGSGER